MVNADNESGDAGRSEAFSPGSESISTHQQEGADDGIIVPLSRVGQAAPRALTIANMISPAMKKRAPAIAKGGIVETATRMPKYVLPQSNRSR